MSWAECMPYLMVPIYLDRKPQLLDIAGKPHVLHFVEGFFITCPSIFKLQVLHHRKRSYKMMLVLEKMTQSAP